MPQRLTDIVGKLYRPPADGSRQMFALSRADAEKLPRLPSIAVISITTPGRPPADINGFAYLLRVSFADVDFLNPDLSDRARAKLGYAFTPEHSHAIRSFAEALPKEAASLVIHCEGGYSRSCAVAVALHRLYGFHAELQHLAQANPSIVRVMMGDLGRCRKPTKVVR